MRCFILKLSSTAKSLAPTTFWNRKQSCKLYSCWLGQVSFWIVLSLTGKAWCSSIPDKAIALAAQKQKFERGAAGSQADEAIMQVSTARSLISTVSRQAKDLALTESSQPAIELETTEFVLDPSPKEVSIAPSLAANVETTPQRLSKSFPTPRLPSNRCWRSTSGCSYAASKLPVIPVSPTEGRVDPEIGDLRLSPLPQSGRGAELGELNIQPIALDPPIGAGDPELGVLRLQERTVPQPPTVLPTRPRQPSAFLSLRADYFKTSNVFSDVDPVDDGLVRTGLTFFYAPPIGPRTFLITSIDANLIRYTQFGRYRERFTDGSFTGRFQSLNYDELRLRLGVFHRITPRLSGEIGWSNQKLFTSSQGLQQIFSGEEFFGDNSIRLELSRQDQLSPRLSLSTFYQFRWSLAEPNDRSRILNSFIATLGYNWSSKLQTAIDYQFSWSHFTQQDRDDLYHQLVARLTYNATPRTQVNVFSGFSFGNSSDRRIDFDSFIFGAGIVFNLPLF